MFSSSVQFFKILFSPKYHVRIKETLNFNTLLNENNDPRDLHIYVYITPHTNSIINIGLNTKINVMLTITNPISTQY